MIKLGDRVRVIAPWASCWGSPWYNSVEATVIMVTNVRDRTAYLVEKNREFRKDGSPRAAKNPQRAVVYGNEIELVSEAPCDGD